MFCDELNLKPSLLISRTWEQANKFRLTSLARTIRDKLENGSGPPSCVASLGSGAERLYWAWLGWAEKVAAEKFLKARVLVSPRQF